jgi:hypothetical protein
VIRQWLARRARGRQCALVALDAAVPGRSTRALGSKMSCRLIGAVLVVGIVGATSGCEQPFDRSPPGFADACYGGRSESAKNWVCSDDRLVLSVEGNESDWPTLARIVSDFGRSRGLDVFDTSSNIPNYVRTLEVSVCSSEGLFLLMDKRVYSDQSMNRDGNRITAHLRTYEPDFSWKPLADEFVATLRQSWDGAVQVEWPEFIPASEKKALPDSVKSCDQDANTDAQHGVERPFSGSS